MSQAERPEAEVPRFSTDFMDRTVDPTADFYEYSTGGWRRDHPIPADKSSWGAFGELLERNFLLIRELLESASNDRSGRSGSPRRQVGDLYASALDTERRELLRFAPIQTYLDRVERVESVAELFRVAAELHDQDLPGLFEPFVYPDRKQSSVYAFYLYQGGLTLPDREYYLAESFEPQREAYRTHLARMFELLGDAPAEAMEAAATVVSIETELARASRSATELRDQNRNYNRFTLHELVTKYPTLPWGPYCSDRHAAPSGYVVVGQPEFFTALETLVARRPIAEWKTYLRWNVVHANAPFLHASVEDEDFDFFHRTLLGQREAEPPWRRAALVVDQSLGEALGQLYVERHFTTDARERMAELVSDLREVFRDRLAHLDWMTESTREKALAKFDRFQAKIGHPDRFRDYSSVLIRRDEFALNRRRAAAFEVHRQMARIGEPVDRTEWGMTPPTVNAYFSPVQNEIVFPAGILQPPFFDVTMDDAVNYGGIGAVIGHEITHGYDDQGRRFDAEGNLNDWWSEADAREFMGRAQRVVELYSAQEALPGVPVNGELTLGENIADFGGVSVAYAALQRRLSTDPTRRKVVEGLTPEQRFFISWAQVWRQNIREAEALRRVTIDSHAPGPSRGLLPVTHHPEFNRAFPPTSKAGPHQAPEPQLRIW